MAERERALINNMRKEGLSWSTIQRITGRSPGTLSTALTTPEKAKKTKTQKGQPKKLTGKAMTRVLRLLETLHSSFAALHVGQTSY